MKKRIGFVIDSTEHTIIKSEASLLNMSMIEYIVYCHQTVGKLISIAKNEGNKYQDIPEAIDEMFECPATEDSLKMFFEQFAEKTKEEIN